MKAPALAAILTVFAIGDCAPTEGGASGAAAPETQAACQAAGGDWRREGRAQMYRCVISYSDAGARCADAADCQGECRLPELAMAQSPAGSVTGQCQANSSPFGCYTRIENGQAAAKICVD